MPTLRVALVASWSLVSSVALAPAAAGAQTGVEPFLKPTPSLPPDSGPSFALRAGYGIPLGTMFGTWSTGRAGNDLSDAYSGTLPLEVDVGWRFSPRWYLGGYYQYAFGFVGSGVGCTSGVSCTVSNMRFGVDVAYTFLPEGNIVPWAALGAGYEIGSLTANQSVVSASETFRGWEFGHLTVGVDYRLSSKFRIGPFATFAVAQYTSYTSPVNPRTGEVTSTPPTDETYDIDSKGIHEWLQLGIKATLDL